MGAATFRSGPMSTTSLCQTSTTSCASASHGCRGPKYPRSPTSKRAPLQSSPPDPHASPRLSRPLPVCAAQARAQPRMPRCRRRVAVRSPLRHFSITPVARAGRSGSGPTCRRWCCPRCSCRSLHFGLISASSRSMASRSSFASSSRSSRSSAWPKSHTSGGTARHQGLTRARLMALGCATRPGAVPEPL